MDKCRFTLILEPISKRINVLESSTVYESLIALNIPIGALCAGKGTCGKCLIRILSLHPKISEPTEKEKRILDEKKIEEGYRLACQTKILGDLRVFLMDSLMPKGYQIVVDADLTHLKIKNFSKIQPIIISKLSKIRSADLDNPKNDLTSLIESIIEKNNDFRFQENNMKFHVNDVLHEVCFNLPKIMRQDDGLISTYFRNISLDDSWSLFDIDSGDKTEKIFGLAVDMGTTTIVGYLICLKSGEIASIAASLNPQVAIGEDIISRISYIVKNNAVEKAQDLIINAINQILEECCYKAKIPISWVRDISIVGNTGMHHILFGMNPEFLSISPYVPVFKVPINISAKTLKIKCNPYVNVYSPPVVAGYVGTDTIGCIISSKMYNFTKYTLLIDIGTNGELILGNKEGLITASCAAGSALEGAHISHGMRASEGAIESVAIDRNTLEPSIGVIGKGCPLGLCGSGLIDIIAEMLKSKIITRAGIFNIRSENIINHRRITKKEDGYHYIIFNAEWDNDYLNLDKKDKKIAIISISQKDINQIQLAKAAFLSSANLLLQMEEKTSETLEQILLAGGFGTYINKENAAFIGLFPEVEKKNIFQIGNAAGMGAQLFVKDFEQRKIANNIAHEIKYKEIASLPTFQKEYTLSLYFPHYNLERFPMLKEEFGGIP